METTAIGPATVKPFDEIPMIYPPDNYPDVMPRFLARMALEHGPIFRRPLPEDAHAQFGKWLVYLVGPEANRFVMQTQRERFSQERGWPPNLAPLMEKGLLSTDEPE